MQACVLQTCLGGMYKWIFPIEENLPIVYALSKLKLFEAQICTIPTAKSHMDAVRDRRVSMQFCDRRVHDQPVQQMCQHYDAVRILQRDIDTAVHKLVTTCCGEHPPSSLALDAFCNCRTPAEKDRCGGEALADWMQRTIYKRFKALECLERSTHLCTFSDVERWAVQRLDHLTVYSRLLQSTSETSMRLRAQRRGCALRCALQTVDLCRHVVEDLDASSATALLCVCRWDSDAVQAMRSRQPQLKIFEIPETFPNAWSPSGVPIVYTNTLVRLTVGLVTTRLRSRIRAECKHNVVDPSDYMSERDPATSLGESRIACVLAHANSNDSLAWTQRTVTLNEFERWTSVDPARYFSAPPVVTVELVDLESETRVDPRVGELKRASRMLRQNVYLPRNIYRKTRSVLQARLPNGGEIYSNSIEYVLGQRGHRSINLGYSDDGYRLPPCESRHWDHDLEFDLTAVSAHFWANAREPSTTKRLKGFFKIRVTLTGFAVRDKRKVQLTATTDPLNFCPSRRGGQRKNVK